MGVSKTERRKREKNGSESGSEGRWERKRGSEGGEKKEELR